MASPVHFPVALPVLITTAATLALQNTYRIDFADFLNAVGGTPVPGNWLLGPLAATRGIRLTGRPSGGATVRGDAQQLDRAITNLVANAIRHTPDDGAVEVEVLGDGATVEVAVRDQCGGIAAADLPRLYDVGFRGESARTARTGDGTAGAGLGLAIARGIVEAHHGTIHVANTADGCRFVVTLPAA